MADLEPFLYELAWSITSHAVMGVAPYLFNSQPYLNRLVDSASLSCLKMLYVDSIFTVMYFLST